MNTLRKSGSQHWLRKVLLGLFTGLALTSAAKDIYSWQNVKIGGGGGFIPGIIYNESEKNLLYIRTDMGGMYRYDYATKKNIPLTDWVAPEDWNWLGAESFATDPVEPNKCYLAAGTYTNDWTDHMGAIYRSEDYGDTWTRFLLPIKCGGNMPGRSVGERLQIDPHSNNVLYFGARSGNGLWKSTDSGETWSQIKSLPVTGTFIQDPDYPYTADPIGIGWIAFDTKSSEMGTPCQHLFVGAMQAEGDNVYESTDGGETWTAVAGQPTNASYTPSDTSLKGTHIMPHHGIIRDSFLYLPYNNKCGPYDGSYGEVWKYNIYSKVWTDITPHSHEKDEAWGTDNLQSESCYFGYGGMAVDYNNPDRIIVATLNSYWPDAMLFFSEDGGKSWYRSFYWTSYPSATFHYDVNIGDFIWLNWGVTSDRFPDVVQPKLGWMIGDMEINPFNSEEMLYGTGATVYGTSNLSGFTDTTTTMHITSWGDGIEECAVLSLCVPPVDGVKVVTGVGDLGGFTHSDINTPTQMWTTPVFSRGASVDYAELNPKMVIRAGQASPSQYEDTCNFATSSDGGLSWNKIWTSCKTAKNGSVAISAKGSYNMWSTEDKGIWGGKDGMSEITDLPKGCYIASDRVNDSVFYAYSDGKLYTYNFATKTILNTGTHDSFPSSNIYIKAVPGFEGHVWLPCNKKGLFMTEDGGKTFVMPCADVDQCDVIGFGKAAEGKDYPAMYMTGAVKGKTGVFRSIDKGVTWERINDDMHQYGSINYAISGDMRTYGLVYFGTNGRGVICGQIASTEPDDATGVDNTAAGNDLCPVGVYRADGNVNLTDVPVGALVKVYDATGRMTSCQKAESDEISIPVSDQLHIVSITFGDKTTSVKF